MKRLTIALVTLCLLGWLGVGCDDDGGGPTTCTSLCDLTPVATLQQGQCVGDYLTSQGYPVWTTAECMYVDTIAECNACYAIIQPSDAECTAAYDACF